MPVETRYEQNGGANLSRKSLTLFKTKIMSVFASHHVDFKTTFPHPLLSRKWSTLKTLKKGEKRYHMLKHTKTKSAGHAFCIKIRVELELTHIVQQHIGWPSERLIFYKRVLQCGRQRISNLSMKKGSSCDDTFKILGTLQSSTMVTLFILFFIK